MSNESIDQLSINTIRTLAVDAVQQANSGHPGTPMGAAPMAFTIWNRFLRHNPENPTWPDRDRFVLSPGHASMLLYSLLPAIHESHDPELIEDWRRLSTSDHFYYICTKWFADGDVHKYFSPYDSPYDAYITYMNVLQDLESRIKRTRRFEVTPVREPVAVQ